MTLICGVEEAGRGPLIGPLVMVGLVIEKEKEENLRNMGVKDSKQLTPLQRERLFENILELATKYKIVILEPKDIDNALLSESSNLNWLEADTSALIVNELQPEEVTLDCPSTNTEAYHDYFVNKLEKIVGKKAVVIFPNYVNYKKLIKKTKLKIKGEFSNFIHHNLTRKIIILEK